MTLCIRVTFKFANYESERGGVQKQSHILVVLLHSNRDLMRVSGMAYAKSRLTLDLSKCKQSGPYELLSSCRLTAASKRIMRCVFAEWKRVQEMCPLARTHVLVIKNIYENI